MVAAAIIGALIGLVGILLKNEWVIIIGLIAFLYLSNALVGLPPYIWIIAVIILFFWIRSIGGKK